MDFIIIVLIRLLDVYQWIIFGACIVSFLPVNPYNAVVKTLRALTFPLFNAVRKVLPLSFSMIDLSPMVVIFGIYALKMFLIKLL